jgi:hypothetical protein
MLENRDITPASFKPADSFRFLGKLDVTALKQCVLRQSESAWSEQDYRQEKYAVHRQTQTIYLLFDNDFRHFESTNQPRLAEFAPALRPVVQHIAASFGNRGWPVRCILTRLVAGGEITPHKDFGFSLMHSHRVHIPLVTNPGVMFTVGERSIHMQEGELWEINNSFTHRVVNGGPEARVHMILDWAEPPTHSQLRMYRADRERHRINVRRGSVMKYD